MIDFRYHVVSIVAVFLSLAIGLVLGANALQQPMLHALNATNKDLHNLNSGLRSTNDALKSQIAGEDQLTTALAPQLLPGRLKDQSVVFVQTPGGNADIYQQLSKVVQAAGAKVQGEVTIQSQYLQQDQQTFLDKLVTRLAPTMTFHEGATLYDRAGTLLAGALVTKVAAQSGSQETTGVLSGFSEANFITAKPSGLPRGTLAIMIPPSNPDKTTSSTGNDALVSLAGALADADLATVMAGPLTAAQNSDGAITALRNSNVSSKVSSVDSVDAPTTGSGQVIVVLALENQITTRKAGAYGTGSGAGGYLPSTVPTPTASPTGKGT